jgi:hypothetical protein
MKPISALALVALFITAIACGGSIEAARQQAQDKAEEEMVELVLEQVVENQGGKAADFELGDNGAKLTMEGLNFGVGEHAKVPADWPPVFQPPAGANVTLQTELLGMKMVTWEDKRPVAEALPELKAKVGADYKVVQETAEVAVYDSVDGKTTLMISATAGTPNSIAVVVTPKDPPTP